MKVSVILAPALSIKEDMPPLWAIVKVGAGIVVAEGELDRPDQRLASSLVLMAKW